MSSFRLTSKWLLAIVWFGLLAACRSDNPSTVNSGSFSTNQVKIEVAEDGMVQLSLADLQAAGLSVTDLDSSQLYLSQAGTAVPYILTDTALIFYGQAPTSRYTAVRPYILEAGKAGQVMAETAAVPDSSKTPLTALPQERHLEENQLYL
ncbi:MAG: hypothetical protein P8183_19030, partial [Anaerolineae bacterium]